MLDTAHGCPASGMSVALLRVDAHDGALPMKTVVLNEDGRAPAPLVDGAELVAGRYRLVFDVAAYFRGRGVALPDPPFLDRVTIEFGVADASANHHVPLLVSPWSYATYRGS